jgi:hypothetical protein
MIGNPVALVNVPLAGVPNTGATKVALSLNTLLPVPVKDVTPVPPLATDKLPVVPAMIGNPVALVNVTLAGVPRTAPAPNVATPVTPRVVENAPDVPVSAPVTAAPAGVTSTMVEAPESNDRLPDASAVWTIPPTPVVIAAIVDAIFIFLV